MKLLLFLLFMIAVGAIVGAIFLKFNWFSSWSLRIGFMVGGLLVLLIAIGVSFIHDANECDVNTVCEEQQIVQHTNRTDGIDDDAANRYLCLKTYTVKTAYTVIKLEEATNGNFICCYQDKDGEVKFVAVSENDISTVTDKEDDVPKIVKTEVFKTLVFVKKPSFFEDALLSIAYEDFSVGDIYAMEKEPLETTYAVVTPNENA